MPLKFYAVSNVRHPQFLVTLFLVLSVVAFLVRCTTDPSDAQALGGLYDSFNNPPQLTNWARDSVDPCGEAWMGITCAGTAVVSVQIPGLGINGTMGYLLSSLKNLEILDLSDNNIHDGIPYQLPPNLTSLNLAGNNLSSNLPYSIAGMSFLQYLNVSHNVLSMEVADVFTGLGHLSTLDLSFNNFSGKLPRSFISLTNLSELYVQNNSLNGTIDVLANLTLTTLNVANNDFNGSIPEELLSIPYLINSGNSFDNAPESSPPLSTRSSPLNIPSSVGTRASPSPRSVDHSSQPNNGLRVAAIIGMCFGAAILAVLLALLVVFCLRRNKMSMDSHEQRVKNMAAVTDVKPLQSEIAIADGLLVTSGSVKRMKSPTMATAYSVATLQVATNSFSQENIVGEGSLGRVYRAEFSNGKVMAIKKIDNAALSLQEDENFLEAVSNIASLRHPNIVSLLGYCAEHKQRLLVYEFFGKGSLHDMLHFSQDDCNLLSWNARVRVALGTARALEYLHEVSLPPVVHRNLKSANILLDEELNPHLSDSGLASLTSNPERQVATRMIGSFGYSAPEYGLSGIYTIKSDVYSFGVVMLELLTGRKPLDSARVRSEQSLVRWATPQLHDIDALAKMVDPALNGMYPVKSLSRFADIIALCVQPEPEFRPPMSEVVQALVRLVQRASVVRRSRDELGMSYRTPEHEAIDLSMLT